MTKKKEENTQPLWEKEYIKSLGLDLLNNTIKYLNNELSFPEYEVIRKKHADRFLPFTENQRKNYEKMMIYDDLMVFLTFLRPHYKDKIMDFYESNADLLYILNLILLAETQIKGEMEYNMLLHAIPKDIRETLDKDVAKEKDIDKSINTLASLNFAVDKEKKGDNPISAILENPTLTYCETLCIRLIYDVVCEEYGIKEKVLLPATLKQETYISVIKTIKQINAIGNIRIRNYEDTLFYKRLNKYIHLADVKNTKEYKEAEKKAKERIKKYIKNELKTTDKGLLLLDDLMEILAVKGWWFVNE